MSGRKPGVSHAVILSKFPSLGWRVWGLVFKSVKQGCREQEPVSSVLVFTSPTLSLWQTTLLVWSQDLDDEDLEVAWTRFVDTMEPGKSSVSL
jgi:hypothetical protein